jgi:DNA polymerase III subunit epsilon
MAALRLLSGWIARWTRCADPHADDSIDTTRWVIADVETTGLDMQRDHLIAIGAVAIQAGRVVPADAFYKVLRQPQASSRENILVHGIGGTAQLAGEAPAAVLDAFERYVDGAPLVGYSAPFDARMIERAKHAVGRTARSPEWIDLVELGPAVIADGPERAPLDRWLERYTIDVYRRHDALADALATARLAQILFRAAQSAGHRSVGDVRRAAAQALWLRRHRS